jgi:hypothetical protein
MPTLRLFDLPPLCVEFLSEVAVPAHQRYGNEGNLEIGGRTDHVTGKHA